MGSLYPHQLDDFAENVLAKYDRGKWVDIEQVLQQYHFASRWFKTKKKPVDGGTRMEWKLVHTTQDTARHTGLYAVVEPSRKNVFTNAYQNWSKQDVHYTYDLDEREFMSGPETIIDYLRTLEDGLYRDFFALMETAMWTAPSSSSQDPMPPSGIPFWLQKNATEGFNGGDPSGWSDGAGNVATGTYDKWKNYTFSYASVNRADLITKVVRAMRKTRFIAPRPFPSLVKGQQSDWRQHPWGLYTVLSVLETLETLLESQNENLGRELAWGANREVMMLSNPLTWVPALSESDSAAYDSTAPIYGVNWLTMEYFFQRGRNMRKLPPKEINLQPTVRMRYMYNWGNFRCKCRRENFAGYYAAS